MSQNACFLSPSASPAARSSSVSPAAPFVCRPVLVPLARRPIWSSSADRFSSVKIDIESGRERRDVVEKRDGHNRNKEVPAKNLPQFFAQLCAVLHEHTVARPVAQLRTVRWLLLRSRTVVGVKQSESEHGNTRKEMHMQPFLLTVT